MTLKEIISTAILNPDVLWVDNKRQENKLRNRLKNFFNNYEMTFETAFDVFFNIAASRLKNNSLTLFFPNIGSSGSHLIQEAINRACPAIPLGEVYIPPSVIPAINKMENFHKNMFMEVWHLIHAMDYSNIFNINAVLINTVHNPTLGRFSNWTQNFSDCLIIRNPVDLVLSRTFRKDDYRKYVSADENDLEYLNRNIKLVSKFYRSALDNDYSRIVKFEDIFANRFSLTGTINPMLDHLYCQDSFINSLEAAVNDGKSTNQFSGTTKEIPQNFVDIAKSQLYDISKLMGYSK